MQIHERCLREREDELAFRELVVERQAKLRWSDFFGDYKRVSLRRSREESMLMTEIRALVLGTGGGLPYTQAFA